MNKSLQDQIWSSLPEEAKAEIIDIYNALRNPDDPRYNKSLRNANLLLLQTLFGSHNLSTQSQAEPSMPPSVSERSRPLVGEKKTCENLSPDPVPDLQIGETLYPEDPLWSERRYETARHIMASILIEPAGRYVLDINPDPLARTAVQYADALISKLKSPAR